MSLELIFYSVKGSEIFFVNLKKKMRMPLPLPEIVRPTESFERVMLPGLVNPRSEEPHPTIPHLVKSLDSHNKPSAIEIIKHRHDTRDALPSYHGSIMRLSKGKVVVEKEEDSGTDSESEAEVEVRKHLAKATTKEAAKKEKKALGKKKLTIKEHARGGLD